MSNDGDFDPNTSELLLAGLSDALMQAIGQFVTSLPLVRLAIQAEGHAKGDPESTDRRIQALSNWTITLVHLCAAATVHDSRYNGVVGVGVKTVTEEGETSTVYALGSVLREPEHLESLETGSVIRFRDDEYGGRYVIAEKFGEGLWETKDGLAPTPMIPLPAVLLAGPPTDDIEGLLHGLVEAGEDE